MFGWMLKRRWHWPWEPPDRPSLALALGLVVLVLDKWML